MRKLARIAALTAACTWLAGPLSAAGERQGAPLLPAYYDVVAGSRAGGNAQADAGSGQDAGQEIVYLRRRPDAGSEIVGQLPPNRRNVEIVALSEDGAWGLMAEGEGGAWAPMARLSLADGQDEERLPENLGCFGSEPFWILRMRGDEVAFDEIDGNEISMTPRWQGHAEGRPPQSYALVLDGADGGTLNALIRREQCSDTMSDRPYGFSIDAILGGKLGQRMLSGCCSLP